MDLVNILISLLIYLIGIIIIVVPIILIWEYLKLRKIKKKIPENMQEEINKEKENERRLEDEREKIAKEETARAEREPETKDRKPAVKTGTKHRSIKRDVKPKRVQIPDDSKSKRKKPSVKLHKPTAL